MHKAERLGAAALTLLATIIFVAPFAIALAHMFRGLR